MAPEQWAGAPASPSTDIYAATATFYECLTGRPPYRAPGDLAAVRRQHEEAPIPVDNVAEPIRGLIKRGLAKKPENRPRDAGEFLRELESVAGAGYGEDWEEEGRSSLARRAALLLLLFPLAAVESGGTNVAITKIGSWTTKTKNLIMAGGLTLAIVVAGAGGYALLNPTDNVSPIVLAPSPTDSAAPSPSPSLLPSPTLAPSPTPAVTPTPTPSKTTVPPKPTPKPTPSPTPTNKVTAISTDKVCWWYSKQVCTDTPLEQHATVHATTTVTSTTGGSVKLRFRFVQVYTIITFGQAAEAEIGPVVILEYILPAGNSPQTREILLKDDPLNDQLTALWTDCQSADRIKLTVTSTLAGSPTSPAQYLNDRNGRCNG